MPDRATLERIRLPLLAIALLLSGCVCYHTASPTRSVWVSDNPTIPGYPFGRWEEVKNPDYEASKVCDLLPPPGGAPSIHCTRYGNETYCQ
jgi:hypothetical protein